MNFFYQIYYGFINFFSSPSRFFQSLMEYPPTTRALIFGIPSVLIAIIAITTAVLGQVSTRQSKIDSYQGASAKIRDRTRQTVQLLRYRSLMEEIPTALKEKIDDDLLELTEDELNEKRKEFLKEWELYLHKLIELEPSKDDFKFQLAEVATQQGKLALRRTLLDQLAPIDKPGFFKAQINRGDDMFQRKIYDKARRHYENALQSSPNYAPGKFRLIRTLVMMKDYTKAKEYIEDIYAENLVRFPTLFTLAKIVYQRTEKEVGVSKVLEQTIVIVRDHLEKNPGDPRFWSLLLQSYIESDNYEDAEQFIVRKMKDAKSDKEYDQHKVRLSVLYARWAIFTGPNGKQPDMEKHMEYLKKSYVNNRNNTQTLRLIAMVALGDDQQAAEKAKVLYEPLDDPNPTAGVHIEISSYFLNLMQKYKNAEDREKAVEMRDKAIHHLRQAHKKNANDNQVRNNLAYLLIQQGEDRIDEALQLSTEAVKSESRRRTVVDMTNYYDTYGHVQMAKAMALRTSETENAKRYFLGAISAFHKSRQGRPNNVTVLKAEAVCHRAVGNAAAAEKLEKRVKEIEASKNQGNQNNSNNN